MMSKVIKISKKQTCVLLLPFALAACSTYSPKDEYETQVITNSNMNGEYEQRLEKLQRELSQRNTQINRLETELQSSHSTQTIQTSGSLFPPNALPGHCYARILIPEKYKTYTERVLAKEASERVEVIPAKFKNVQERVLVKEASTRLEVIPATYKTVTERVLVNPGTTRKETIPAQYRTVTERVLDKAAHTVWKKGPANSFRNVVSSSVDSTGEVMCLVEVPATYRTVTKQVVSRAAQVRDINVPAEYRTITKRIIDRQATTREITIPASYDTVSVRKEVVPSSERRITIPEEYKTVTRKEKVSEAAMRWEEVLCEVNMTPENIRSLQRALNRKGHFSGTPDGVLGQQTINAVNNFAKARGIAYGDNYVPVEVVKQLGLSSLATVRN